MDMDMDDMDMDMRLSMHMCMHMCIFCRARNKILHTMRTLERERPASRALR